MKRQCDCGCDTFRFKFDTDDDTYGNICRNCNHTLAEHIDFGKQSD